MIIFFAVIIFEALLTFVIKDILNDVYIYSFLLVFINIFILSLYLLKSLKKEWLLIIYIGFVIRVIIVLVDLYVPSVNIFSSGTDSEYFHNASLDISSGIISISEGRTYYVTFLSALYYMFGDQRLLAQFLNVSLWVFSSVYLYKTLCLLRVHKNTLLFLLILFVLIPNGIFMSSILLRESLIVFFITISLYYFFRWLRDGSIKDYIMALLLGLGSMIFHAGMVGFILAYIIALVFKDKRVKGRRKNNKFTYIILISTLLIILFVNQELFLTKFISLAGKGVENISIVNHGTSAYLQSFGNVNGWKVFLLAPLKMVYFLFSPMPMDWRGMSDIISFFFDSLIYLFFFASITYGIIKSKLERRMKIIILIMLFLTTFIFAFGTGNAGTAIRHRYKLLPLFIFAFAFISPKKMKRREIR